MLSFQGDRSQARQRQNMAGLAQVTHAYQSDGKSGEKVATRDDYTNARLTRSCAAPQSNCSKSVFCWGRRVTVTC